MNCNIALTGFMGSGKTSVGKELRMLLPDLEFIDLDAYIEAMTGTGIPEIFEDGAPGHIRYQRDARDQVHPGAGGRHGDD